MATSSSSLTPQPEPVSPVKGLIEVFANPSALFARLRDRPDWLIPLLVGAAFTLIFQYFLHPYTSRAVLGMITDSTPPQAAQAMRESATKPAGWTIIFQPISYVVICLIGAGILSGLAAMFTASAKFKQIFSAFCYAKLVMIPAMVLSFVVVSLRGVDAVNGMMDILWSLGPAMFVTENKFLFNVLTQINLFEAWYVVLLVIAVQKISGAKRGTAITAVAVYWVIGAATQIGMLMMGGLR
jgi:hypothetical protein